MQSPRWSRHALILLFVASCGPTTAANRAGTGGAGAGGAGTAGSGGAGTAGTGGAAGVAGSAGVGGAGSGAGGRAGASGTGAAGGGAGTSGTREICGNFVDDTGDGFVDEGCPCTMAATQPCWPGPPERRNRGACHDGTQRCVQVSSEFSSWGPCDGATLPTRELPSDGIDQDCDGVDEVPPGCSPEQFTPEACSGGRDEDCDGLIDCQDPDCAMDPACRPVTPACQPQFPFFVELACTDGMDNDCDGRADCDDPDCRRPGSCGCAASEGQCSNGTDDDCDGSTDCADLDCQACTPGSRRFCDAPMSCAWGTQECGPDGRWGACIETGTPPAGCSGTLYNRDCCVMQGQCCQNYPTDNSSVGPGCAGIVMCM